MKRRLFAMAACLMSLAAAAQSYETRYTRPVHDIMADVEQRFGVKFKYDMDTTGLKLAYADFRVRPYSLEETLQNICAQFDWNYWKQNGNLYKIKLYEYPRRHVDEGQKMLNYLSTLYADRESWETRKELLRREVRERLEIDNYLDECVKDAKPQLGKIVKHDGYTTQNICIELTPGEHLFGTIYSPMKSKKRNDLKKNLYPLIVCPDGHWPSRYRKDEQQRLGTLARMGAICVDYDLYGYGESKNEAPLHNVPRAHIYQAACGLKILDYMLSTRRDIDTERVAACGGSGGGTHTVLLALLDNRINVSAPVVHLASHFDGGCPCESGMPVQLAGGGTCEPELAAIIAPNPMLVVSDGGDWTASVPEVEMPYLKRIYSFYGAEDKVENVHIPDEGHNFGPTKRNAVYDFFIRIFSLDKNLLDEKKITIQTEQQLTTR